jgi:hypothetical protein
MARGMAQVVECLLPSKCETMSTTERRKRKEGRKGERKGKECTTKLSSPSSQ